MSEVSLVYIVSHAGGSLSILLMFSLAAQKLLNLMQSHFFLSFICLALGDMLGKILLHGMA